MKTFKQFYISEELSSSEEVARKFNLELVEQIDFKKISGINGYKQILKNDNKKNEITQVVPDKDK